MISIDDVTFDDHDLVPIKAEVRQREWVDPLGAYLMARVVLGPPTLPASIEQLHVQLAAEQKHGRLVAFEGLRVGGVSAALFVVELAFDPGALEGVGQTPSYTATMTVPLMSCSVDINAAYNTRLAELAPTGAQGAPVDDPPAHLLALLRRVANTTDLGGSLAVLPPFWADG